MSTHRAHRDATRPERTGPTASGPTPTGSTPTGSTATGAVRVRVRVDGIVQGVGFRPFVHALAGRYELSGLVGNDVAGVFIEVEGPPSAVAGFRRSLVDETPPLALIERVGSEELAPTGGTGFVIADSRAEGPNRTLISPDTATCADCLNELFDPADRRHRYPFINCTNCGPRFTIIRDVPYDRPYTTMADFPMCADCAAEYHDPADRRFHAQPVCCPRCGPSLSLVDTAGRPLPGEALAATVELLRTGGVVAVKGLGGYHLAADATNEVAVQTLRSRKHREDKPFAVMVPDLACAEALCEVDDAARALLTGRRRPIVVMACRDGAVATAPRATGAAPLHGPVAAPFQGPVAASVAPGAGELGVMLPYTPLHHLLLREAAGPLVLTSGNVSDEPIAYLDEEALDRLGGIADAFLRHDRPIHMRTDDSVLRSHDGRVTPLRRSRGYAPQPIRLDPPAHRPILACGAELKNTFCLAQGDRAFVSHHIGDLENYETLRSFTSGIAHFQRLFAIEPQIVAYDRHPEYLSSKYALERLEEASGELIAVAVQHHHAHIASCLADNGVGGPVIGVAFDGLGYGTDGTLWGGEFLVASLRGFSRAGHLAPVPLPGGAQAIREPWRMALSYLTGHQAGPVDPARHPTRPGTSGTGLAGNIDDLEDLGPRLRRPARWEQVAAMIGAGVNAPPTSSAGRLFDAVAAVLDLRDTVTYEGQAAIELERCADQGERGRYPVRLHTPETGGPFQVIGADLVHAVLADRRAGVATEVVAARFHNAVASMIVDGCVRVREHTGLATVALSGGVFQNRFLVERTVPALESRGFAVLTHRDVPPNDGGISLGQAAVAAALHHPHLADLDMRGA